MSYLPFLASGDTRNGNIGIFIEFLIQIFPILFPGSGKPFLTFRKEQHLPLLQLNDFRVHENQQLLVFGLFQIGLKQPSENRDLMKAREGFIDLV